MAKLIEVTEAGYKTIILINADVIVKIENDQNLENESGSVITFLNSETISVLNSIEELKSLCNS